MKKILIVDDHPGIRRVVRATLDLGDYEVHEADNGATALDLARRLAPDVVLLDVMMPGELDGIETCALMRREPSLAGTKIVMLTARGSEADHERGYAAGANVYLVKPFSPLELLRVVAKVTEAPPQG